MTIKHRVTINLDDKDFEALTRLSKLADRPLAYLGRMAVQRLVSEELEHSSGGSTPVYSAETSVAE